MLLHWTTLMQQLKKLFTNGHLHCGLQVYITFKKVLCNHVCPVFTCSRLIISYWLVVFNKSLNQLFTIVYFIYSLLVVKWVRREIHFFLIKIHKLTMCKIHCIVRDMSSSIISVSLLTIYLKRATCICVLSVRNNQVCLFFTTYIAITCTMYILYQPSYG